MNESLFGEDPGLSTDDETLISVYEREGRTLDDLPYTEEFGRICGALDRADAPRDVFHRLHNLRKAGKLPRMGKAASLPVKLEADEEAALVDLLRERLGTTGARDRLPYTEAFGELHAAFNARIGRDLDRHALWRLICKLAK
ncbi:MAG: hypothetical protein RLN60_00335 [Phycisphaerales bacterium]